MKIINLGVDEVYEIGKGKNNFVFGASDAGKKLVRTLIDKGIEVLGIWDNNVQKQGKKIEGISIISYEELKKAKNINLWIGCGYAMQEEARIDSLDNIKAYRVGQTKEELKRAWRLDEFYFPTYAAKAQKINNLFADDYSRKVNNALVKLITQYDITAIDEFVTAEEHYFVKEVIDGLSDKKPVCVDCGAFTGEMPIAMRKMGINYKKCYCFEMDPNNCNKLELNMNATGMNKKVIIENSGIGEINGHLYFESIGANSRIVDYKTPNRIQTIKIDTYFQDIHIDYIKMDIEGAELGALRGGISVIQRDRPILAISVYHSLQDRTDILEYLHDNLMDYQFYLRQHAIWDSETVLYGIPNVVPN